MSGRVIKKAAGHGIMTDAKVQAWLEAKGLRGVSFDTLIERVGSLGASGVLLSGDQWYKAQSHGRLNSDLLQPPPDDPRYDEDGPQLEVILTGYSCHVLVAETYLTWKREWEKWAGRKLSWPGN